MQPKKGLKINQYSPSVAPHPPAIQPDSPPPPVNSCYPLHSLLPCLPPIPTSGFYCSLTLKFSVIKILRKLHPQFFSQKKKKRKKKSKKKDRREKREKEGKGKKRRPLTPSGARAAAEPAANGEREHRRRLWAPRGLPRGRAHVSPPSPPGFLPPVQRGGGDRWLSSVWVYLGARGVGGESGTGLRGSGAAGRGCGPRGDVSGWGGAPWPPPPPKAFLQEPDQHRRFH